MAQSLALLRQWLKLLDYETSEVLWRAAHARGMPCADSAAGGRTIAQTAAAVLGFRAHVVEGDLHAVLDHAVAEVRRSLRARSSAGARALRWVRCSSRRIALSVPSAVGGVRCTPRSR